MFELEAHGGLGRKGTWTRSGRALATPLVLFVQTPAHPAPPYAEALLVSNRIEDPRLQIRVSGSFFEPREAGHPDDLPPSKGTPLSMADLEFPEEPPVGDVAIVTAENDLSRAANAEIMFLANGPQFERSPREFVAAIRRVKESLGPARVLAVTGLATPSNVPVLGYAGSAVIDSSRMVLDSARGLFHTSDGSIEVEEAEPAACGCPSCVAGGDLQGHNDFALHRAVLLVRNHLAHGRLRELVERRLANAPWNTAVVRHLDLRGYDLVEPYTPVAGREMLAYASESLHRPEVVRFRRRIVERYAKPPSARVLLLLPCSARKPYSASRSHRRFREAIQACKNPSVVHEVIVTSPLGLIPRELERFYPAGAYDIPVTGDWSRDEAAVVADDLEAFVSGATFRGRFPDVRVLRQGTQVAMHTGRGLLSLTLAGGEILSKADAYWVDIEDFHPVGNIFAVGVRDASPEIRPGDEVAVRHGGEVRAVGTARLSAREMKDFDRGEAVHVRHVREASP